MRMAVGFAILTVLLCGGQSASAQMVAGNGSSSSVVLSPGDAIRIDVWRNRELSGEFPIAADGSITHPLYRELTVTGLPLPQVESKIREFLSRFESNPSFVMTPLLRIIVGGEVRQPNMYTVPPGTTVAQAIALAGGPSDRGRLDRVALRRAGGSQSYDLTTPDAVATRVEVHSGDQILVGRRRNIMQDVVSPSGAIVAALASLTSVIIQVSRKN